MKVPKSIINVLENESVYVGEVRKQDNSYYCEIEFTSDAGEDVIETVWFDGTKKSFIDGFNEVADDFDADDHAEMWVSHRGENGVPYSIRELIDDADAIKAKFDDIASKLNKLR